MIGIVVVAHSAKLAEAAVELSRQMAGQRVSIVAAGGTGDPENPFGTNALNILEAVKSVGENDGVLVLMDIGSALLSAEMALELMGEEQRTRVCLCAAPLVEGAVAAAVRAGIGGSLDEVCAEALGALEAKKAQLQPQMVKEEENPTSEVENTAKELRLTVQNRLGIHARPAAKLVAAASAFRSTITVFNLTRERGPVNARSINLVATLGALQGHEILVRATGPDAEQALETIRSLASRNFDESVEGESKAAAPVLTPRSLKNQLAGIPIAPGIALGPLVRLRLAVTEIKPRIKEGPEPEWIRLQGVIDKVKREIRRTRDVTRSATGEYAAAIFDAHLFSLEDPALLESIRRAVFEDRQDAETAWQTATDDTIESYQALSDPYLRSRAADLSDLKVQVLRRLTGQAPQPVEPAEPAILIAEDLKPSDIGQLDSDKILAICTAGGTADSHAAILARSLGIPVVFGLGQEIFEVTEGTRLVVDGLQGSVIVNPGDNPHFVRQVEAWQRSQQREFAESRSPAATLDGQPVRVMANVGSLAEARRAARLGAEGVGLLRTEFLFGDCERAPSEEDQAASYATLAQALGGGPVTIRAFDVGGDKPLSFLKAQKESNPFLGQRGIRLLLDHEDLLKSQLKAILRGSISYRFRIMFPMISSGEELERAKDVLSRAETELRDEDVPFLQSIPVGIMIETPAAAIMSEKLARRVDFFSLGTNDLSQYVTAADRTNPRVAAIADPFHPAVLRLIRQSVKAGRGAGITTAVCGEMAAQPLALPLLLGLGVRELSVNVNAIAGVKKLIRRTSLGEVGKLAEKSLECDSADQVKSLVSSEFRIE